MPSLSYLPETPAPLLERPRLGTGILTHWRCRIGRRIQLARAGRLTREALAGRLGLMPRRLWEMENGILDVPASEIALIAEALGVHPGYFFDQGARSDWTCHGGQRPAWILAKTIAELDDASRAVLESLALYFAGRQTCQA